MNTCRVRLNIDGRNSFITGFGRCLQPLWPNQPIARKQVLISIHSTAHPLSLNGLAPWGGKRVCRASPYSPSTEGNVPFRCVTVCPVPSSSFTLLRRCKSNKCNTNMDNPSLWSEKCRDFAKRAMVGFKLQSVRIKRECHVHVSARAGEQHNSCTTGGRPWWTRLARLLPLGLRRGRPGWGFPPQAVQEVLHFVLHTKFVEKFL